MGSYSSDQSRRSRGVGQSFDVPTFEKDQEIVQNANDLQTSIDEFFTDVENAVGTIEKQVKAAQEYAQTIADLYSKLGGFKEPLQNLIDAGNFPQSVIDGAKDVQSQLDTVLSDLESEYNRAATFIEENSGGGSSSGGSSSGETQTDTFEGLPDLAQVGGGLSGPRGMGQGFQKNEELISTAEGLLQQLQQFEELPTNPGQGPGPGGGASIQVMIPLVNPETGETVVARNGAEAQRLKNQGFVEQGAGDSGNGGDSGGMMAGFGGVGTFLGLGVAGYALSRYMGE